MTEMKISKKQFKHPKKDLEVSEYKYTIIHYSRLIKVTQVVVFYCRILQNKIQHYTIMKNWLLRSRKLFPFMLYSFEINFGIFKAKFKRKRN